MRWMPPLWVIVTFLDNLFHIFLLTGSQEKHEKMSPQAPLLPSDSGIQSLRFAHIIKKIGTNKCRINII